MLEDQYQIRRILELYPENNVLHLLPLVELAHYFPGHLRPDLRLLHREFGYLVAVDYFVVHLVQHMCENFPV